MKVSKFLAKEFVLGKEEAVAEVYYKDRGLLYFIISTFPKGHALSGELSWTHYRLLLKVEDTSARDFYIKAAIENNWSHNKNPHRLEEGFLSF